MKYIAEDYIQHNPNVQQGREGILVVTKLIRQQPEGFVAPGRKTPLHVVAEGDLVVVIWNQPQPDPNKPGETYIGQAFDMFRVKDGMVVEHWDDTRKSPRPWNEELKD